MQLRPVLVVGTARPALTVKAAPQLVASGLMLALAAWFFIRHFAANRDATPKAFFFDLSEKKLFVGPSDAIPPIRGINDVKEDGVKAMVISTNGDGSDKSARKIAYLEMFAPELKAQLEDARARGGSPAMSRAQAQQFRLVRRPEDAEWMPLSSRAGQKIINEWLTAGPDGGAAVVCAP